MNKTEYLNTLEKALVGRIDPDKLRDTMSYYNDYFYMEQSKGIKESDIIEKLGEPRLLAKSIITAENESLNNREVDYYGTEDESVTSKKIQIPFLIVILIIVLMFFAIISLIFKIASVLLPIILPVVILWGIISYIRKH